MSRQISPWSTRISRRVVLRGAGVALSLPFFESLQPRSAKAQAAAPPTRFLPIFLPQGAPELWTPSSTGAGAAWTLSSVLEPFTQLKSQVTVISGLENGSVFNIDGSSWVEPAARQTGAWLTCADAAKIRVGHPELVDRNGVSVDQVIASFAAVGGSTTLPSVQLGLSTVKSYCDGQPCSLSRSVSFDADGNPLYKIVDPKQAFKLLTGAVPGGAAFGLATKSARQSVLDTVLASAAVVQKKLGRHDQRRLDEFLQSVRAVEQNLTDLAAPTCPVPAEPVFPDLTGDASFTQNIGGYDKGAHADVMNELIALAFQCNVTRVISYMLEDERSDFVYDNVQRRTFTATTSTPTTGLCGSYHAAQQSLGDELATITWWNASKVSDLCQRLAQLSDGDGSSVLDNSVVFFGSATHGSNNACANLPSVVIGSGGGKLKVDQHVDIGIRPMRDFYFTLMNGVFDLGVKDFGSNLTGAPIQLIDQLLA